uniref:SdpI family protein n=1 Tax=Eubacterium cellulosolvens TaxID=29322 RepID=UPI001FA79BD2|nr:SdpI family protein [[Eubacterium] cellulosolvens]
MCDSITPLLMIFAGRMMWKHCSEGISRVVGYRSSRSMKNLDTWKFAQEYCGKTWWLLGFIMLVPSVLVHIPFYHSGNNVIGTFGCVLVLIQCLVLLVSLIPTEAALEKTFDEDGLRR